MISPETIDRVLDLSIVDVVSHYVDLKKAGSSFRANSPFTDEKTPSFYVVPSKNIFKCFSSGKGGGSVKFVMEHEKLLFPQAIEAICNKFGIQIQYEQNGQPKEYYDEIEQLYKINEATAKRYSEALLEVDGRHPAFTELINNRRYTADTILQWGIGYAPGEVSGDYTPTKWNFLSSTIVQNGYYKQGIELGLIKTKNDVNYDTFRNRVMYPVVDHHGRYVGFGARALKADNFNAKYLNSSESRIFNKSKILFGLYYAAHAIRKKGFANLMEGYTDVISFHQAGQANSVGTCGTSLTDDQCKLLKKYTDKVVLFGDSDVPGQNAVMRSIDLLMKHGFQTSVVPMPDIGKKVDPDDLTRMF